MKQWIIIPIAVVLSVVASIVTVRLVSPAGDDVARAGDDSLQAIALERIDVSLAALVSRQEEMERDLEELRLVDPGSPGSRVAVDSIDRAVARWMEEHGMAGALPDGSAGQDPGMVDEIVEADLDVIMGALLAGNLGDLETQEIWQRLREADRLDEVIAEFERIAEEYPNDPDVQVDLANAYLQKIFDVGAGPLAGVYGMKADEAYDRALELDENHWEARFTKAISLSNWPAFMGKSGEAIHQFEVLLELQRNGPSRPEYAQTYYFLGNMYLQAGDTEKALQTWREGLGAYPDSEMLLEQLALMDR